jgi:hypothetical protein
MRHEGYLKKNPCNFDNKGDTIFTPLNEQNYYIQLLLMQFFSVYILLL